MKWRVVAGFLVGILAITLFVVLVGWEDVFSAIGETDTSVYAIAFGLTILALIFRSLVWIKLLSVLDHGLSRITVAGIFVSAKFFKYISPYGQISATPGIAWFLGSFTDEDYERNLAAIVSADLFTYSPYYSFGGLALIVTLLGAATFPRVELYLAAAGLLMALVALALWTVLFKRGVTEQLIIMVLSPVRWLLGRLGIGFREEFTAEALSDRLSGFYGTIDELIENPRTLVMGLIFGHIAWLFLMLPLVIIAAAMGVELSIFFAMLIIALSKLGFIVPLPGGIAGVEFTIAGLLVLIAGVSEPTALAMAILYRFSTFWFTVLIGGVAASMIIVRWPGRDSLFGR